MAASVQLQATIVLYCNACGMPPEYCEYGPDFETHCVPWLRANHPNIFERLHHSKNLPKSTIDPSNNHGNNRNLTTAEVTNSITTKAEAAPSAPWSNHERLSAFYSHHSMPDKLHDVDNLLQKYSGREDKLFAALVAKYGPEPIDPYWTAKYGDLSDDDSEDHDEGEKEEDNDEDENANDNNNPEEEIQSVPTRRRGAPAKKTNSCDNTNQTRVILQKISRNRKKAVTHIVGLETIVPPVKLKEAAKAFSKKFAGSASVKDNEVILQGDHLEEVAAMIVEKWGVSADCVFLDVEGEFLPYGG